MSECRCDALEDDGACCDYCAALGSGWPETSVLNLANRDRFENSERAERNWLQAYGANLSQWERDSAVWKAQKKREEIVPERVRELIEASVAKGGIGEGAIYNAVVSDLMPRPLPVHIRYGTVVMLGDIILMGVSNWDNLDSVIELYERIADAERDEDERQLELPLKAEVKTDKPVPEVCKWGDGGWIKLIKEPTMPPKAHPRGFDRKQQVTELTQLQLKRTLREWPVCMHGGAVDVSVTYDWNDAPVRAELKCSRCSNMGWE